MLGAGDAVPAADFAPWVNRIDRARAILGKNVELCEALSEIEAVAGAVNCQACFESITIARRALECN